MSSRNGFWASARSEAADIADTFWQDKESASIKMRNWISVLWKSPEMIGEHSFTERVGCMARVTWKHTLPCVKWTANVNLLYDSGNSNWGSVTT